MMGTQAQEAPASLEITLFGPFQVCLGGQPLPRLRSHKEQWLLALLTLRANRPVERNWLAGTLWPESTESQAANNLRRSLWNLRQALGTQAVRLLSPNLHTVQLDLTDATVDVLAFDHAISQANPTSLETAIKLYGGPLLEGCTEEWAFPERQSREQTYLSALEKLAEQAMMQDKAAAAIDLLRKALLVDPLRETVQRSLMQALAASGDQATAVLAYRDYRLLLRREFNAEPDLLTAALFEQIRQEARQRVVGSAPSERAAALLPESPGRLPAAWTGLVGREQELVEIGACLQAARLVTLTGTGGVGKTRLAIEAAQQAREGYAQGAWFIDLAPLVDGALVEQAVASVLGIREKVGRSLLETLCDDLAAKQILLVLDNCEHLINACARLVTTLLQSGSQVRILATSRQPLGLIGEVAFRVPSLSLPPIVESRVITGGHARGERAEKDRLSVLLEYEAPRLFVERARQALPAFKLSAHQEEAIGQICRQLDGIPLAIELAAARVKALSIEQIAARLEDRFPLLTGGSRTALPRQQTLRALIDWSYDLLADPEKSLLARLSVFAGGWTLEAAEAICAGGDLEAWQVLDLLASLVDKSLVIAEGQEGKTRYRLLETIRQYSWERLQASREEKRWHDRHLEFFLSLAEEAGLKLIGAEQIEWLQHLDREHDNLRAALNWSRLEKKKAEAGQRLAGALWTFWEIRGYWSEGREYLQAASSQKASQSRTPAQAKTLDGAGRLAYCQGDYTAARTFHEESLAIKRELGDKWGIANALLNLGNVAKEQGDYAIARTLYEQSLALDRELGNNLGVARSLNNLGLIAWHQGDFATARALHEQSLAIDLELGNKPGVAHSLSNLGNVTEMLGDYAAARTLHEESLAIDRELGNKLGMAMSLNNLGLIAEKEGEFALARTLHEESLAIKRVLGNKRGIARSLNNLGDVAYCQDDFAAARTLYEESLAIKRELGDKWGIANALLNLGNVTYCQGDYTAARALYEESLAIKTALGDKLGIAESLAALAELAAGQEQTERAARLWAAMQALRASIGSPLPPNEKEEYDRMVAAARMALGEPAFSAAWAQGQAMSLDQVMEDVLAACDHP